jgi:hypothetical protein
MLERGHFRNTTHAEQLISFVGLQWGKITPSDIDAAIDFGGRAFVYIEVKYDDTPISRGQELLLERLCGLAEKAGVFGLAILAKHHQDVGTVILADAKVVRFYWRGDWHPERENRTVRQALESFHARYIKAAA